MKAIPVLALLLACGAAPGQAAASPSDPPARPARQAAIPALPQVRGVVEDVDPAAGLLVLQHEDIPNFGMSAMTMGLRVASPAMLAGLRPGDEVLFQADMRGGEPTIVWLRKRGPAHPPRRANRGEPATGPIDERKAIVKTPLMK